MKKIILLVSIFACFLHANEKIKIYFDAGGSVGGSYANIVATGAKMAAKDLGVDLRLYYSDWSAYKMINNFKKALASGADGIAIMGHPGDDAFSLLLKRANDDGVFVSSLDTPLPKLQSKYQSKGFGYVGTNNYKSGQSLAKEAFLRAKMKKGDTAMIWGLLSQPTRGQRAKGMIDELKRLGAKVDYIEISNEINKDPTLGSSVFTAYITKNPKTKLILIDHGGLSAQMENFCKIANVKADEYFIAGYSLSPATIHAIKKGFVDLIGDGQPFLQGYLTVVQLTLSKRYGFSGLKIDTGAGFIDKNNISFIEPLAKKSIR